MGIGTPNIRVRFLDFAFRFLLDFFAFRFLAMPLPLGSFQLAHSTADRQKGLLRPALWQFFALGKSRTSAVQSNFRGKADLCGNEVARVSCRTWVSWMAPRTAP